MISLSRLIYLAIASYFNMAAIASPSGTFGNCSSSFQSTRNPVRVTPRLTVASDLSPYLQSSSSEVLQVVIRFEDRRELKNLSRILRATDAPSLLVQSFLFDEVTVLGIPSELLKLIDQLSASVNADVEIKFSTKKLPTSTDGTLFRIGHTSDRRYAGNALTALAQLGIGFESLSDHFYKMARLSLYQLKQILEIRGLTSAIPISYEPTRYLQALLDSDSFELPPKVSSDLAKAINEKPDLIPVRIFVSLNGWYYGQLLRELQNWKGEGHVEVVSSDNDFPNNGGTISVNASPSAMSGLANWVGKVPMRLAVNPEVSNTIQILALKDGQLDKALERMAQPLRNLIFKTRSDQYLAVRLDISKTPDSVYELIENIRGMGFRTSGGKPVRQGPRGNTNFRSRMTVTREQLIAILVEFPQITSADIDL